MTVISGTNLDALVGKTFATDQVVNLTATTVDSGYTIDPVTATISYYYHGLTADVGVPFTPGVTYKVIAASDANGTLTLAEYINGTALTQITFYVDGYGKDGLVLSLFTPQQLAVLGSGLISQNSVLFGLGSALGHDLGQNLGFTADGSWTFVPGNGAVNGTAGPDRLTGSSGADIINGLGGNDVLEGGAGADKLFGGAGKDVLIGGPGKDTLTGGAGADRFVFKTGDFGGKTAAKADVIADFHHAQGDIIDLSGVDADTTTARDQSFAFVGKAAFDHHAGELRYAVTGGHAVVEGDTNGDGLADFALVLNHVTSLVAADFVL